ncbi:hypothetical protein [Arcicella rosea]|uniref:Uncharacterized protein n=1 Tax=Arcicella rosea TaxID=502909 RepID=A0A841ELF3_9BACT|nr:hypothetical protein [Arcicella rosea]MBB6004987.1 hypothetical protein [Arcicella rosea]
MEKNILYFQVEESELNSNITKEIKTYSVNNPNEQLYIINAPLGEKNILTHIKKMPLLFYHLSTKLYS